MPSPRPTAVQLRVRGTVGLLLSVALGVAGLTACEPAAPTLTAFLQRTWVPNAPATYVGRLTPAATGSRVVVQRLVGTAWSDVAGAPVAADGTYRVPVAAVGAATVRQRVVARGADGQQSAASGESLHGSVPAEAVSPAIASWLAGRRGSVSVAIYDARTGRTSYYGNNLRYYSASIAKVSILDTVAARAAGANRPLTATEKAHAQPMITWSSNDDATWLWSSVGRGPAVAAFQQRVGMKFTVQDPGGRWGLATTTAADQARLVEATVWPNPVLRPTDQDYARSLMRAVIPSQRWGVSAGAPAGATVELKNGWLPYGGNYNVNSIGHVSDATHDYVIAVLTKTPGTTTSSYTYGIATIEGVTRLLWGQRPSGTAARVAADTSVNGG